MSEHRSSSRRHHSRSRTTDRRDSSKSSKRGSKRTGQRRKRDIETRIWARIAFATLLMAITYFAFKSYPEHRIIGSETFSNSSFEFGTLDWVIEGNPYHVSVESGVLTMGNPGLAETRIVKQGFINNYIEQQYRISGHYSLRQIRQGKLPWDIASGAMVFFDSNDSIINSHTFFFGDGTWDWQHFSKVVSIPSSAYRFEVHFRVLDTTGEMRLRGLSLLPATENAYFLSMKIALFALWCFAGAWLLWPFAQYLLKNPQAAIGLCAIAVTLGIGIMLPESVLIKIEAPLRNITPDFIMDPWRWFLFSINHIAPIVSKHELAKLGHLVMFALLTFYALKLRQRISPITIITILLLLAPLSETLQQFASQRTPTLKDMYIDSIGIILGFIAYSIYALIKKGPTVKSKRQETVNWDDQ